MSDFLDQYRNQELPTDLTNVDSRRIVMVIDHLESGGAHRQFCILATTLHHIGYSVTVLVYRPGDFFYNALRSVDVRVEYLRWYNRLHLLLLVRRQIRRHRADVVISFLAGPNLLTELSGLPFRKHTLIVSERNADTTINLRRRMCYLFHRLADVVVSNSYAQGKNVAIALNRSQVLTKVIVNGVDTHYFKLAHATPDGVTGRLKLLVIARLAPEKNVIRFIESVRIVCLRHPEIGLEVDWYGRIPTPDSRDDGVWTERHRRHLVAYYESVKARIEGYDMQDKFRLLHPQTDVRGLYLKSDVLCLPSLREGCSNVIAEAMASGIPVLAGYGVGDNARLVVDGRNGFLFDPTSEEDIARAIVRFARLSKIERRAQGIAGRKMADTLLSVDVFVREYAELIANVNGAT